MISLVAFESMSSLKRLLSQITSRCLASSSSDNSPAFQRWVSMIKQNPKSLLGRQNRVCLLVLLSSLEGLEFPYESPSPESFRGWAIVGSAANQISQIAISKKGRTRKRF